MFKWAMFNLSVIMPWYNVKRYLFIIFQSLICDRDCTYFIQHFGFNIINVPLLWQFAPPS